MPDKNSSRIRSGRPRLLTVTQSIGLAVALLTCTLVLTSACHRAKVASAQESTQEEETPADLSHPFMQADLSKFSLPAGIPELDPPTADEIKVAELGRRLFFDPILSSDASTSCATCHRPENAFSSPLALAKGVQDRVGDRHPPTLVNRHLGTVQFWDGRVATLEEQALEPIENENELASSIPKVLERLNESDTYKKMFADCFEDGISRENLASAIAGFERLLANGGSRIDRFVTARESVLTKSERQGLWLYESKGGCWKCHSGQNYSDEMFHNTGVSVGKDLGRFDHTNDESHKGQFKTPTLRNVGMTAPYMHDGSIKTLREVVEFYNKGGENNPHLDEKMEPLELNESEVDDLVAFLKALDGRYVWESANSKPSGEQPADDDESE